MNVELSVSALRPGQALQISGSKSETNRLLLLQALYPQLLLENTSDSDDSEVMRKAIAGHDAVVDIHHAGTAMRFLTAYFAIQDQREVVLTGSSRMKERPIKILVDALRSLGADINYLEAEGFPPLKIKGKNLTNNKVSLAADVSSQYISALLLIAPRLEKGLNLTLEGRITSVPYINMTLGLLREIGVDATFGHNVIAIKPGPQHIAARTLTVESDWSSASYFYSIVALSAIGTKITLSSYRESSLQGDRALADIYQSLGVRTIFEDNRIVLHKQTSNVKLQTLDLNQTPDIAQTIAVTAFGLGIGCHLTGLHTLKIKETDRLVALQTELSKLGANVRVTDDGLTLAASSSITPYVKIATYNDHRMAMAFAPLALKVPLLIGDAEVVSKSYPNFWNDLQSIGFEILPDAKG